MRTLLIIFTISLFSCGSQNMTKESITVKGNCGMCETRIEEVALSIDGVDEADWDKESKLLSITFDKKKTSLDNIHKVIAEAGHDTDLEKADIDVYEDLPGCCKYDRME